MPTNAKLEKEIKSMKTWFEEKLTALTNDFATKLLLSAQKVSTCRTELNDALASINFLRKEYDMIKTEKDKMRAKNASLNT